MTAVQVRKPLPKRYVAGGVGGGLLVVAVATSAVTALALLVVLLLALVARLVWPYTPHGRFRRLHGQERRVNPQSGWSSPGQLRKHLHAKAPATVLGRAAIGVPQQVSVSHEESIGVIGGPRRGKSALFASIIRRHRGGVVSTSSRLDLLLRTLAVRARTGGPVWVFLPDGASGAVGRLLLRLVRAGWVRLLRFDVVAGCEDPKVASERAGALVGATDSGSADDQTWLQSATTVLRCLLHAAALSGRSMLDVHRWVTCPDEEPVRLLDAAGRHQWAAALAAEMFNPARSSAGSVMRAARLATGFMDDPLVAATCCPAPGESTLDVRELVEKRGALFLVGQDREFSPTKPLLSVLLTHVFDTAVAIANENESGRLNEALHLSLDEAGVTFKVPLDKWLAFAGGHRIHIGWGAQSFAQPRERWGDNGATGIVDCSTALLVFGGVKGRADLETVSALCGDRREPVAGEDGKYEWRPTLPTDRLYELPKFRAVLLGPGAKTLVATPRWKVEALAVVDRVMPVRPVVGARAIPTTPKAALESAPRKPIAMPPVQMPAVHTENQEIAA